MNTLSKLELARRQFRMAEKELAEIAGQRKAVEQQLERSRAEIAKLGIDESRVDEYLLALENELTTISQELDRVAEEVEQDLVAYEA